MQTVVKRIPYVMFKWHTKKNIWIKRSYFCSDLFLQFQGIDSFCTLKYDTTFPRFKKIDVNGEYAAPLYNTWHIRILKDFRLE